MEKIWEKKKFFFKFFVFFFPGQIRALYLKKIFFKDF